MENLKQMFVMFAVMLIATSVGCGSPNPEKEDPAPQESYKGPVKITGSSQKGPLQTGSSIVVNMFDADGFPTGDSYPTTISDDLGSFSVVAETTGSSELVAQGFYFNEISNRLSGSQITLRSVYDIIGPDPQAARINVFTHMASGLALSLLGGNISSSADAGVSDSGVAEQYTATTAEAYAEEVLFQQLGIIHPSGGLEGYGAQMDLTGVNSSDNQYLMAVSCIIANAANLRAIDEDEVDARLQEFINDIRSQLTLAEEISDEYKAYLVAGETSLSPMEDCVDNLVAYLEGKTGSAPALPDPNASVDIDQDGIPNASDPDIDGDGFLNEDDEMPLEAKVGNGIYFDSENGLTWERTPSSDTYTHAEALSVCENLTLGNYDDWRMPTISELRTLVIDCPETETGGECAVTDECLDLDDCFTVSTCQACINNDYDSCYWDNLFNGLCVDKSYWSVSLDKYMDSEAANIFWAIGFDKADITARIEFENYYIRCVRDI